MATPTFALGRDSGDSSGTSVSLSWTSARTSGQPLYAIFASTPTYAGGQTISVTGWDLVERFDLAIPGNSTLYDCVAFYRRTATDTSADNFVGTVGSGIGTYWRVRLVHYTGVVGSLSGAETTSSQTGGGTLTASVPTITRADSRIVILQARPGVTGLYPMANGYAVDSGTANTFAISQAVGAGTPPTPPGLGLSTNRGGAALAFGISGIPDAPRGTTSVGFLAA